jgi:hypothetical protein
MERGSESRSWLNGMVPPEILGIELDATAAGRPAAVAVGIDQRGQTHWLWDRHVLGRKARSAAQRAARVVPGK